MFDCIFEDCPQDSNKCACWWELPWENEQTGETKIRKGCILSQEMGLPIVQSIVRAAHVSSEHASQARNTVNDSVTRVQQLLFSKIHSGDPEIREAEYGELPDK